MKYRKLTMTAAACGMLLLILDSEASVAAAYQGLRMCLEVVIPSLLPFFLLSGILIRSLQDSPGLRPLERLLKLPRGCGCYVLTGLLGGYPIGAQSVAEGCRKGYLSREQAHRLLSFCSQAGPSFLFGMAAAQFPHRGYGWALWGIQLLSALVTAWMISPRDNHAVTPGGSSLSLPEAMASALRAMAMVCGWVILFRVILTFLQRWILWILPTEVQTLISGILELSNGCLSLSAVPDVGVRFILATVMLNFGGICVAMQTAGVTSGLDLGYYWRGKLLQTGTALAISSAAAGYPAMLVLHVLLLSGIWCLNSRKSSSFRAQVGV